jgi:hypothetical protein
MSTKRAKLNNCIFPNVYNYFDGPALQFRDIFTNKGKIGYRI